MDVARALPDSPLEFAPMAGSTRFPFALLIRLAQHGDPNAFSELVRRVGGRMERIALRVARNPCIDVEDVLQESLVQAFHSIRDLRVPTEDGFLSWFAGIVRHRVGDAVRKNRERKRPRKATPLPWALQRELDPALVDALVACKSGEMVVREGAEAEPEPRPGYICESRVAFVLREGFASPWPTLAMVLGRRNVGGMRRAVRDALD